MRDELETLRLRLRRWHPDDLDALARRHVDSELMRYMAKPSFTREEMRQDLERYERHWAGHGFGLWAARRRGAASSSGAWVSPSTEYGRTIPKSDG